MGGAGLAGIGLLGAAACGGGGASAGSGGKPSGSIKVWIMQPGSNELESLIRGFAEDFQKKNQGTKIELQFVPWTSAHDQFVTAVGGGQVPDLAEMGTTWTPEFASLGALAEQKEKLSGKYVESLVESGRVNGKVYGLPWYGGARALIYRKDVLDKLGLKAPQSWDDIVKTGEVIKKKTSLYPFGVIGDNEHQFLPMVWQAGGEIAVKSGGKWRSKMDSPQAVRAFSFYADLFRRHKFSPAGALNWDSLDLRKSFVTGDMAMMVGGGWDVSGILAEAPKLKGKIGTALTPKGPASNRDAFAGGSHLVVFEGSQNKTLANAFARFMLAPERVSEYADKLGFLPGTLAGIKKSGTRKDPLLATFTDQFVNMSRTYPPVPQWGGFEGDELFVGAMQQIMGGKQTAKQALAEVTTKMDQAFKKKSQ